MPLRALWILLLTWPTLADAAAAVATATIVDGSPTLVRASAKFALAEGTRLVAEDIVETGSARHLRLEFADGAVFDLGPATSLLLQPRLSGDAARKAARAYLLRGTAKVSRPAKTPPGPGLLLTSAVLDLQATKRGVVIVLDAAQASVFAESGEASLAERRGGKATDALRLKEGEFFATTESGPGAVSPSPRAGFVQRLPKAFLDTLPARAALFRDKEPASAPAGTLVYADVQPWIDAEPALRGGFVTRWRTLARQGEFRKGLEQGLPAHPEWDRVLHPERYLPKPASAPSSAAPPTAPPGTTRY